jgi:hypothetical protein
VGILPGCSAPVAGSPFHFAESILARVCDVGAAVAQWREELRRIRRDIPSMNARPLLNTMKTHGLREVVIREANAAAARHAQRPTPANPAIQNV